MTEIKWSMHVPYTLRNLNDIYIRFESSVGQNEQRTKFFERTAFQNDKPLACSYSPHLLPIVNLLNFFCENSCFLIKEMVKCFGT